MTFYEWLNNVRRILKNKEITVYEHGYLQRLWGRDPGIEPAVAVTMLQDIRGGGDGYVGGKDD